MNHVWVFFVAWSHENHSHSTLTGIDFITEPGLIHKDGVFVGHLSIQKMKPQEWQALPRHRLRHLSGIKELFRLQLFNCLWQVSFVSITTDRILSPRLAEDLGWSWYFWDSRTVHYVFGSPSYRSVPSCLHTAHPEGFEDCKGTKASNHTARFWPKDHFVELKSFSYPIFLFFLVTSFHVHQVSLNSSRI